MPSGTKVESLYRKLLARGYSTESAVRIAQAKTGLSLETGKPPKGGKYMASTNKMRQEQALAKLKARRSANAKAKSKPTKNKYSSALAGY